MEEEEEEKEEEEKMEKGLEEEFATISPSSTEILIEI